MAFSLITPCVENKERIVSMSVEIKVSWENRAKRWAVPPTSSTANSELAQIFLARGTPYSYMVLPVKNFRGVIGVVKEAFDSGVAKNLYK